ncbi:MAG: hypothetical protein OEZ54_01430 [Gemmatimonadota bacterium]|nr:hypothetical protein [Gemmatimonadota bacterium]
MSYKLLYGAAASVMLAVVPVGAVSQDEEVPSEAVHEHEVDSIPPITIEAVTEALGLSDEVAEQAAFHVNALAEALQRVVHMHKMHMDSASHGAGMDHAGDHAGGMHEGGEHADMGGEEHKGEMQELHEGAMAHHGHIDEMLTEEQKTAFKEYLHGWLESHGVTMMGGGEMEHEGIHN